MIAAFTVLYILLLAVEAANVAPHYRLPYALDHLLLKLVPNHPDWNQSMINDVVKVSQQFSQSPNTADKDRCRRQLDIICEELTREADLEARCEFFDVPLEEFLELMLVINEQRIKTKVTQKSRPIFKLESKDNDLLSDDLKWFLKMIITEINHVLISIEDVIREELKGKQMADFIQICKFENGFAIYALDLLADFVCESCFEIDFFTRLLFRVHNKMLLGVKKLLAIKSGQAKSSQNVDLRMVAGIVDLRFQSNAANSVSRPCTVDKLPIELLLSDSQQDLIKAISAINQYTVNHRSVSDDKIVQHHLQSLENGYSGWNVMRLEEVRREALNLIAPLPEKIPFRNVRVDGDVHFNHSREQYYFGFLQRVLQKAMTRISAKDAFFFQSQLCKYRTIFNQYIRSRLIGTPFHNFIVHIVLLKM